MLESRSFRLERRTGSRDALTSYLHLLPLLPVFISATMSSADGPGDYREGAGLLLSASPLIGSRGALNGFRVAVAKVTGFSFFFPLGN